MDQSLQENDSSDLVNPSAKRRPSRVPDPEPEPPGALSQRRLQRERKEEEVKRDESEKIFRLPDIRRVAVRRPPPRVYPQPNPALAAYIQNQQMAHERAHRPEVNSNIYAEPQREDRGNRLRRMYEELNRYKAAYYGNPPARDERPVRAAPLNVYHLNQQAALPLRPSWWG